MLRSVIVRALALSLPFVLVNVGCGGDDDGDTQTTTTTTTTSSTGGSGGEGGNGSGGNGGEGGSVQAECAPADPETYDGTNFATNAATELALRNQLNALNGLMRNAETDLTVTPTSDELVALFDAGTPSLRDATTTYYQGEIEAAFDLFAAAAGNTWTPASPPVGDGGKYGAYIFSAHGNDLRQTVEKGLFGAAFYHHAASLSVGPIEEATIDQILAAFGAHPTFPGDSETADPTVNPNPDRIGAQYAERRSPKDPGDSSRPLDAANPGPYFRIKANLIKAQAAVRAGAECNAVRDQAIKDVLLDWERVNAATVIYYMNSAATQLTTDNAPETTLAAGLHGYGEGVAFLHGFRQLPATARLITDAQIDALLELIHAPIGQDPRSYELITDGSSTVPALALAIEQLATIYSFSAQDVEAFKVNH
ncbi:hypothetical protein [Chondromyces crocatus]|uniref:Imelysin-like domain-containing protein n=1 Tax=Chondromyces crocatus TaxID=52 RepID=A0A0K1EEX1_CHOCO|nr:hypothetical protein [Chondromyces crocatus]AKT39421.1 uncharacterized protein CMC5_035680 [Chondromyces crocatus]